MQLDELREYCLLKPGVTEGLPFGPEVLVFKVMNKMFALVGLDDPEPRVNLKGEPVHNLELRERYDGIISGWHMNKTHWNTVYLESDISTELIHEMVDESYRLVVSKLTKKVKAELDGLS